MITEMRMESAENEKSETPTNTPPPLVPGTTPPPDRYAVRALVDSRYDLQRLRISVGHRRLRVLRSWITELGGSGLDDAGIAKVISTTRIDRVYPAQKISEREVREIREELAKEIADEDAKAKKDPSYRRRTDFPEMVASKHTDEVFYLFADLVEKEKRIEAHLKPVAETTITGRWLLEQRGIAGVLACGLLSYFDPTRAAHASSYWKFAGMAVVDGHADKFVREKIIHPKGGPCKVCDCSKFALAETVVRPADDEEIEICTCGHEKKIPGHAPFSENAKVMCWRVADSFIKSNSPWKRLYDEAKIRYLAKFGTGPGQKDHAHKAAMRVMIKRFLVEFWKIGRAEAGLPVDDPYILGPGGHTRREPDVGI
jgi:hypothetical protein